MSTPTPRVRVPATAAAGETVVIRTLINHAMETGQRRDADGAVIPRRIVNRFTAAFNGETVIDIAVEPAVAANPYFEFEAVVPASGEFAFTWYDDDGSVYTETAAIAVA